MARSKSSSRWLREHFSDPYVLRAQREGLRCRAAYKLQEIQEKYKLIKQGMIVIDLGAAPGGWSELARQWVGKHGRVIALDILPIEPIAQVDIIQADFSTDEALQLLQERLAGRAVNVVLSDILPNMSGHAGVDQPRAMYFSELALDFAVRVQCDYFVCKVFQGEGFDAYLKTLRKVFTKVVMYKPDASRDRSREVYAVAMNRYDNGSTTKDSHFE